MKLISNTSFGEFCKSKEKEFPTRNVYLDWYEEIRTNYDSFLKQSLNLGMLVPCDQDGNVLKMPNPNNFILDEVINGKYKELKDNYINAKERVLFEGFCINGEYENTITLEYENIYIEFYKEHGLFICGNNVLINIEDLSNYELQLTESAIKQIGL